MDGDLVIERWFTQTEWQGIQFADLGIPLDPKVVASADFYAEFYRALTKKYSSYEELPADWRMVKRETARGLALLMPQNARVLSCGAGVGYVEYVLATECGMTNLVLWDWAPNASSFESDEHVKYTPTLDAQVGTGYEGKYDFVFLNQVLYGMTTSEAVKFLGDIRPLMKVGGGLILVNTSPIQIENDTQGAQSPSGGGPRVGEVGRPLRDLRRRLRRVADLGRPRRQQQGWGWARDNEAVSSIIEMAGFENITFLPVAHQSFALALA
jgi:hypothetical protein